MIKEENDQKIVANLVNFLGKFKDLKRRGWLKKHVTSPESDAEHSFSVAFLALLLAPKHIDLLKCLKLALIHDIPEIYSNDYLPGEIEPEKKLSLENKAISRLSKELNNEELQRLFNELTSNTSPEAKFIHALDKLDNVFTARYYENEKRGDDKITTEFATSARKHIASPEVPETEKLTQILNILEDKN